LRALSRAPKRAQLDLLLDTYIETYVEWREESDGVGRAYRRWVASASPDRDLAFRAYRAALDREEKAATAHQLVSQRLGLQRDR